MANSSASSVKLMISIRRRSSASSCAVARSITIWSTPVARRRSTISPSFAWSSSTPSRRIPSQKELAKYPKATEVVWCQEEPRNQGAWYWIASRHHLDSQLGTKQKMLLVSRPASSSPAVGYLAKHNEQTKALIESALGKIEY